jgi:hypothetical protein
MEWIGDLYLAPQIPGIMRPRRIAADSAPLPCIAYSLITTAKMNDVDPQAWLADVLSRVAGPAHRIDELLPWNWRPPAAVRRQAA